MKKFALPNLHAPALALALVAWTSLPATAQNNQLSPTTPNSQTDRMGQTSSDSLNYQYNRTMQNQTNQTDRNFQNTQTDQTNQNTQTNQSTPNTQTTQNTQNTQSTQSSGYQEQENELPATASPLALMGGLGLLAMAGGFLLRKRNRNRR